MAHTPPKGSLEDLFRHHLLESEAAAAPPRSQVWEQLGTSLLQTENEKYRRRLLAYRWAVAASLLLASLAGGGWWQSQRQTRPAGLAQATTGALPAAGPAAATQPLGSRAAGSVATASAASASVASPSTSPAIAQPATISATITAAAPLAAGFSARRFRAAGARAVATHPGRHYRAAGSGAAPASSSFAIPPAVAGQWLRDSEARHQEFLQLAQGKAADSVALLTARLAQVALPAGAGQPSLRGVELPALATAPRERTWQFGLAYTTSVFQPNINFAKEASAYNPALGPSSAGLTQAAAAEYRENLQAGLGQRLSVWASRRLGSRFSLRAGLEVSDNAARSASTVAFVGEQVPDITYASLRPTPPPPLRATTHRYRAASVPVEASYGNPTKPGFSWYGRLGGAFTTLLNVHSEVEGNAEAARTYTLNSINSPYRHFSGSVRGGAGMRYRPAGHYWALNLGPVAEAGILSLNLDPEQGFWSQQRPYSFGLEAAIELGRAPKAP